MDDATQAKVDDFLAGYDERKERKLERAERFADNADKRAHEHWKTSQALVAGIPMGQPVLVGHHSEKRHRRTLQRSDAHMGKACEEHKKAKRWAGRAEGIANDRSIHYDDPEAAEKLQARIEQLEAKQELYKAMNKAYRAFLKRPESLDSAPLSDAMKDTVRNFKPAVCVDRPFPSYVLTNNSANIRRLKKRLERLPRQREQAVNGRWLYYVKRDGRCAECGAEIKQGPGKAYWVRAERALYCETCGQAMSEQD